MFQPVTDTKRYKIAADHIGGDRVLQLDVPDAHSRQHRLGDILGGGVPARSRSDIRLVQQRVLRERVWKKYQPLLEKIQQHRETQRDAAGELEAVEQSGFEFRVISNQKRRFAFASLS